MAANADAAADASDESVLPSGVFDTGNMTPPLAPFISKLLEILSLATEDDGIRWGSAGYVARP